MAVEDGAKIHDNTLAHQAREELHINLKYDPPNLPNLNAVEPLWEHVKHRVGKLSVMSATTTSMTTTATTITFPRSPTYFASTIVKYVCRDWTSRLDQSTRSSI